MLKGNGKPFLIPATRALIDAPDTMFEQVNTLIWDWNGTLLDDADICVEAMNQILAERGMGVITKQYYQKVFTFPVQNYYMKLGFDFDNEDWNTLANNFIRIYLGKLNTCHLQNNAEDIIRYFHDKHYLQVVLSAMEQNTLRASISERGILNYFDKVAGIRDHYAASKIDIADKLIDEMGKEPHEVCLIGDTIHDHEVALELGWPCILIDGGHQSHERLIKTGRKVLSELENLKEYIHTE
jgi:phosphoglycolate phosphatase